MSLLPVLLDASGASMRACAASLLIPPDLLPHAFHTGYAGCFMAEDKQRYIPAPHVFQKRPYRCQPAVATLRAAVPYVPEPFQPLFDDRAPEAAAPKIPAADFFLRFQEFHVQDKCVFVGAQSVSAPCLVGGRIYV